MARNTARPKQKASSSKSSAQSKQQELKRELKEISGISSHSDYIRFAVGMSLVIVSLFLLLAIISNIFTGGVDQAGVIAGNLPNPANYAGRLGAYTAYYIMGQLFGVFSILLPIFLLALALKIFMRKACPIRLWILYLHLSIIMVVGSVDANFIQDNILPESFKSLISFELGGMHGKAVLGWLTDNIGTIATGAVLVLLTISYIGYWFTQVFIAIFKGVHKIGQWVLPQRDDELEESSDTIEECEESTESLEVEMPTNIDTIELELEDEYKKDEVLVVDDLQPGHSHESDLQDPDSSKTLDLGTELAHNSEDDTHLTLPQDLGTDVLHSTSTSKETSVASTCDDEVELSVNATLEEETTRALTAAEVENLPPIDPRAELSRYKFPPLSLLEKHDAGNVDIDLSLIHI